MNAPLPDSLYIAGLIHKHLQGTITDEERVTLDIWIAASEDNRQLWNEFNNNPDWQQYADSQLRYNESFALERFLQKHADVPVAVSVARVHPLHKWRWVAAAVVLVFLSVAGYVWLSDRVSKEPGLVVKQPQPEVEPGKNGATLILADGTLVLLDSLQNGVVATQGSTNAILKDGQLVYAPGKEQSSEMIYNTISVPNSRIFRMELPDGTQVWLNSGSSIRYPVAFTGSQRQVEITGEVYFEVVKNRKMPFRVRVYDHTEIEVLGTHFNVNAYDNEEAISTTLLEGSVRVLARREGFPDAQLVQVLQPGQQLQLSATASNIIEPDIDKVVAWKDGLFDFDGMELKTALTQIARWYDVEIVYKDKVPNVKFYGRISRNISLNGLIRGFEGSGVHMSIQNGKQLIIMP